MEKSPDTNQPLERIEAALARLTAALQQAEAARQAAAAQTAQVSVDNQRLRSAMGEALEQIDGLITRVAEASPPESQPA
jgi:chromosome segregation ATPase